MACRCGSNSRSLSKPPPRLLLRDSQIFLSVSGGAGMAPKASICSGVMLSGREKAGAASMSWSATAGRVSMRMGLRKPSSLNTSHCQGTMS